MAIVSDDTSFIPTHMNGKVTVGDLKETIEGSGQVIDSLTSTSTTAALSAAQGKVLKDALDALTARVEALET